ncbi:MAG: agmatine deiminase family protein, partial [Candidatus Cloacimonetes bacterium]|nr:agmatine deiminase family protein [Candidatus Cloacimonadota bacterium]
NSTPITTITGLSYNDTAVTNGNSYNYYVTAVFSGGESDPSNTVNATPNAIPPTNLLAVAGNGFVNLSWNAATGRDHEVLSLSSKGSRAINGYKVYRDGTALTTLTGTSYEDTSVTNETTYSYYITTIYSNPAGESSPSNTVQATPTALIPTEVVLGSGTSSTGTSDASPINVWHMSSHGQSVYTAAELNAAGIFGPVEISQLGFNITMLPALAMPDFVVRMKHTTASNVASWVDNSNLSTVYSNSSYLPLQTGWNMYSLSTPFLWNGTDNILVDTAFSLLDNYNQSGSVQYSTVTSGYRYIRDDYSDQTNNFSGGSTSSYRPNLKLIFNQSAEEFPLISVSPASISETVNSGNSVSRNLTISNTGTADLLWSIPERSAVARNMTGSTMTSDVDSYIPGSNATWILSVTNNSTDSEWVRDIDITFPETVTVNSVTSFSGGEYPLTASPQSGTGVTINWHYSDSNNYGGIYPDQTATATINVSISATASGNLSLPWTISGDDYGNTPHSVSGTLVFTQSGEVQPTDWYSFNTHSGTIAPGANTVITVILDSEDLADGTYSSSFTINSNATNNPALTVPLSLTIETPAIPNPVDPRFVAEWEPAMGAVVRYPFGQPYSLLQDLSQDALLYVIVASSSQATANSNLQSNGVNMANVRYINAASDSYWVRDYGPWTIFDDELNMHLVDFPYNRPRPNDDAIPSAISGYLETGIYDLDITHTGGNIMTDGMGKAMSTELVLTENSTLSQNQINQRFNDILGVTDYQIYTDPNNTYIDHIDCWAKLLDVDKVLIRRVPTSHAQYSAIEQSVAQWQAKTSSYGTPYRIFRVDTPNNEPYTNSFIMNGNIYVPQAGTANDAAALATYQAAMPGFTVRGYSYSSYESTDALHCRVNTIFDDQMIAVRHTPVSDLTAFQEYTLTVEIDHHNALNPEASFIAWSTSSSGPWQQSSLSHTSGNTYSASISSPAYLLNLYYWIQATDNTGRSTKLPLSANLDPFVAYVTTPNPDLPNWIPVSYPNPPATIHASISLFGNPASAGDLVGAFVNGECRGTGLVSIQRNAFVTMQVQLASSSETVRFRIFSQADGQAYDTDLVLQPELGETIGEDSPIQLTFSLDKPVVSISQDGSNLVLNWPEVTNADSYQILVADSPDSEFGVIDTITGNSYQFTPNESIRFFKVIAVKGYRLHLRH